LLPSYLSFHEEFKNSKDRRIFFRSKAIDLATFEAEWVNIAGYRIFPKKRSNNSNFTLDYMFTKTSHMNHSPSKSKALVDTRYQDSLFSPGITFTIPTCSYNHSCAWVLTPYFSTLSHMCLPILIHLPPRIIITHLCNKTTNM